MKFVQCFLPSSLVCRFSLPIYFLNQEIEHILTYTINTGDAFKGME